MPPQGRGAPEGADQRCHEACLAVAQAVGIGGIHRREMRVVERIDLPVYGHGVRGVINMLKEKPVVHAVLRVPADELSLQLEHDDGDCLVRLGERIHAVLDVVGVVLRAWHEPRTALVGLLRKPDEVAQADAVCVFHNGKRVVLQSRVEHRRHADRTARRRAHPDNVMVAPLDIHPVMLHEHIQNAVGACAAVVDVADHVQSVHRHALDQAAERLDERARHAHLDHRADDVLVVRLLVVLLAGGVEQLVDDVLEVLRQCFPHLGAGVFGRHRTRQIDQSVQCHPVPLIGCLAGLPHLLQLFRRVVDQCAEAAALTFRHGAVEDIIHLFPDDAGAVIENMLKRLRLAVQIAHEMLGAFGEVTERVEADQRGACRRDAGVLLCQQAQDFDLFCGAVRCIFHGSSILILSFSI